MNKFIILILCLLIPQVVFAQTFFITGETKRAFMHDTKIALAEDINEKPIFMHFKDRASLRVGAGMKFMESFDIGFHYTHIMNVKQSDNRSMANTIPIGIHAPGYGDYKIRPISLGYAKATLGIKTFDFELGYTFKLQRMDLRLMGGVRHTTHKMRFDNFRKNDCSARRCELWNFDIHRFIDLKNSATGPRFGVSIEVPLPIENYDLKFIGAVNGALLISKPNFLHAFLTTNHLSDGRIRVQYYRNDREFKDTRISTSLDMEGGIKFTHKISDSITLETIGGYRFDGYYGELFTASYTHSYDRVRARLKYGEERENVLMHGPFLRTTLNF